VFHIVSKAENILTPAFRKNQKFALEFYDIVFNSSTEGEFERFWVSHLQHLRVMYDNRKRFAPMYFKKFFPHSSAPHLAMRGQMPISRTMWG
jgi:hypothetical protein